MADITCSAELRSWVVAGRGRHLYLKITCPVPAEHLSGHVEFTEARLRRDYTPPTSEQHINRIAKLDRKSKLAPPPIVGKADHRLEAEYQLSLEQVECMQQDRLFSARYRLLGSNSSSAMRYVLNTCGCDLPKGMERKAGLLGEFPGIDRTPGDEIPPSQWPDYGFANGPEPLPKP